MKLWKFLAKHEGSGRRAARDWLAKGEVFVNSSPAEDGFAEITDFQEIRLKDAVLQLRREPIYIMLNKPAGYVSATVDAEHPTALDLVDHPQKSSLHIAGRLDRASTGLVLLTNDGGWSAGITRSGTEIAKVYLVETLLPLKQSDAEAFQAGFYFHTERITTRPAVLEILGPTQARVTLREGRYHQIKRMFHRVENRVAALKRTQIGDWRLPEDLAPGCWRAFTP
jgi:16S rRNA pseudouridine516 synthase